MDVELMRQHITSLLDRHEIIHQSNGRKAFALFEAWEVQFPAVKSQISYATALHEIGHLLGPRRNSRRIMVRERDAWRWAKRNALQWTPTMERCARDSLDWYKRNVTESSTTKPTEEYPQPGVRLK
jgi:hypothetical protein